MKFYIHHIYLLLSLAALIVAMCFPIITFVEADSSQITMNNFYLRITAATGEVTTAATSWALGTLLIITSLINLFELFICSFQNFTLQKRTSILSCILQTCYYILLLILVLILQSDVKDVWLQWQVCLPLVSLILTFMSFGSIRQTEARKIASATNFRLRD